MNEPIDLQVGQHRELSLKWLFPDGVEDVTPHPMVEGSLRFSSMDLGILEIRQVTLPGPDGTPRNFIAALGVSRGQATVQATVSFSAGGRPAPPLVIQRVFNVTDVSTPTIVAGEQFKV